MHVLLVNYSASITHLPEPGEKEFVTDKLFETSSFCTIYERDNFVKTVGITVS